MLCAHSAWIDAHSGIGGCATAPAAQTAGGNTGGGTPAAPSEMTLDTAITQAAARMEARLPAGTEAALVSVSSPSAAFSAYVLDGLEAALVNSGAGEHGRLVVVDRANLDKVRAEQGFQMSGDVSDESAASIGKMLGAAAIVTGSLTNIGAGYRLTLKAITVEKATVAASYQADIADDGRVKALLVGGGSADAAQTPPASAAASAAAPDKPFADGSLGGVWSGTVSYTAGGQSYRDSYAIRLYADGSCRVSVTAADGAAQTAEGWWADEDGKLRLDCEFRNPAIARLTGVHWLSLYALQNNNRALRVNIRPAPDYAGVTAAVFYKE